MVDEVGTTVYTYDAVGQLLTQVGPLGDDAMTNTYANRLRTRLVLEQPTGLWTNSFAYDAARRLTNVTSPAGAFGYAYDAVRLMLPRLLSLPNTSYITNVYDGNARLLYTKLDNNSGTTLDAAEYGYNVGNQRTTFTNAAGTYVDYTYDPIGQLTVAASSVSSENRGYLYDAAWNLNHRTNNGVSTTFSVNGLNELTSAGSTSSTYDTNGNLISRTGTLHGTNYVYDSLDRLVFFQYAVTLLGTVSNATSFAYDGLGRLRAQFQWTTNGSGGGGSSSVQLSGANPDYSVGGNWTLVGGTYYIYDGNRVIQERDTNGNPTVSYTRGPDLSGTMEGAGGIGGMLARTMGYSSSTGNWSTNDYYHADGNGNITYLVDSSQGLAASYRYDPYGNLLSSSGPLAGVNTYLFSSKEYIPAAGFYYYLYRFYDPGLQRWINRDPLGSYPDIELRTARGRTYKLIPGERYEGPNLYTHTYNDPVNFTDNNGLWTIGIGVTASYGLGIAGGVSAGLYIGHSADAGWSFGLLGTTFVGVGGPPNVFGGGFAQWTNAKCVSQLKGPRFEGGASAGEGAVAGADFVAGSGYQGGDLNFGLGAEVPAPFEVHAGGTITAGPTW